MRFLEALEQVYNNSKNTNKLNDPFFIYSRIMDLVKNNIEEKHNVDSFYGVIKKVNIVSLIEEYGVNETYKIIAMYDCVADIISKKAYTELVKQVAYIIYPSSKPVKSTAKPTSQPQRAKKVNKITPQQNGDGESSKIAVVKKARFTNTSNVAPTTNTDKSTPQQKNVKAKSPEKAVAKKDRINNPPENTPATDSGNNNSYTPAKTHSKKAVLIQLIVSGVIALTFILLGALGHDTISWKDWQWILGIPIAIIFEIAFFDIFTTIAALNDEGICISRILYFGIKSITNFVLRCVYKDHYKILFICLAVMSLIDCTTLMVKTFSNHMKGFGIVFLIEMIIFVVFLIVGLVAI